MTKSKKQSQDWQQLQQEFDIYKIENSGKSLKDFCKLKNINYAYARNRIQVKNTKKKVESYKTQKAEAYNNTLKKKPQLMERKKH
jgi:glutaredoxin-related protein